MFKSIGFAFVFVVLFACDCFENVQAEDPGKQADEFSDDGADTKVSFQRNDHYSVPEDDSVAKDQDEIPLDVHADKEG